MLANVSIQKARSAQELGLLVRRARKERRLTQIELAEQANVARSAVQKLERGRGTVTLETTLKLLRALSLDIAIEARARAQTRTDHAK
jgi:HTH-type transcriptional regulator / antitoxin HipB